MHPRGPLSAVTRRSAELLNFADCGDWRVQDSEANIELFSGKPGADCGHLNEDASSYFDRYQYVIFNCRQFHLYVVVCENGM